MKKHKFNIFPEASPNDYAKILNDIKANGYDISMPIVTYQGDILDGWNRQRACNELGVTPVYSVFDGSDLEAALFMGRTNNRRTEITSAQWACIAAESEGILEAIRAETERAKREKMIGNQNAAEKQSANELADCSDSNRDGETATKAAKLFNTNRDYVSKAVKLKKESPEKFERVKSGELSMYQATDRGAKEKPAKSEPESEPEPLVVDGISETPDRKIVIREDNGMAIWASAKCQLDRISKTDSQRIEALNACITYCQKRLASKK